MDLTDLLIKAREPEKTNKLILEPQQAKQDKSDQTTVKPKTSRKKSYVLNEELNDEIFMKLLYNEYKKNQESSMSYQKKKLSPTDICGYCPRKPYFRFINAPYELQLFYPYSELITHVGSAIHEWVQKVLLQAYDEVEVEYKFDLDDIKGFIDLIYKTHDNKTIILEIKTGGDEIHDPNFKGKIVHWRQVALYYYVWTERLGKPCDKVQLMYLKRDFKPVTIGNQKLKPFRIFTVDDPKLLWNAYGDDLLWMFNTVKDAIEKKQVPHIPESRIDLIKREECGFCPYQKECSKYPFQKLDTINTVIENLF